MMIRPVLICGAEAWTFRRSEEELLERTEMRILRWILGVTLKDRKRSDDIRRIIGVACVTDKVPEAGWGGTDVCSGEKTTTVPSESWRLMSMDNRAKRDNEKDGSTSSSIPVEITIHSGGRRGLCWMKKENLSGWPSPEGFTVWRIERETGLDWQGTKIRPSPLNW